MDILSCLKGVNVECAVLCEGWTTIGAAPAVIEEPAEESLVRAAREGDMSAFERLYRQNAGRVYALCLRLTGRPAEAEDLTQETFIRAWQKLDLFEGRSRFSSWLHRLAVNVVINEHRSKGRSRTWESLDDHSDGREPADPAPNPPPGLRTDLERAIAGLPEGARMVFVLHDIEGHQHGEISSLAGIAVGTSKAQLHRARRLLREALGS